MATSLTLPNSAGMETSGGFSDPGDISAELGETIRSAIPEGDGDTGGGDPSTPEPLSAEGDTATDTDATDAPQADATNEPFPLSEDGKNYLVPKGEFADLTGLREYSAAVQERFPTVQDAQIAHEQSTDFRSMQLDYESGDPGSIDRALEFWTGANAQDPYTRQRFQESFAIMAQRAPNFLQQINPQAHQQLSKSLAQPMVEQAYQKASMETDPAAQKAAFLAAQGMDWIVNGKYKDELPKYDPNATAADAQRKAEANRVKGIEQRETALLDRDFKMFDQQVIDGAKVAAVWSEIDKILAPVKEKYGEAEYGELRTGVMNELVQKLKTGANAEWFGTHTQEYQSLKRMFQQAWKSGQDPKQVLGQRAQYYINDLLVRARRAIPSIAAPRISKATSRTVTQPKNTTARPRTQQPPAATPEKNGNQQHYSIREDQEFAAMFKPR